MLLELLGWILVGAIYFAARDTKNLSKRPLLAIIMELAISLVGVALIRWNYQPITPMIAVAAICSGAIVVFLCLISRTAMQGKTKIIYNTIPTLIGSSIMLAGVCHIFF